MLLHNRESAQQEEESHCVSTLDSDRVTPPSKLLGGDGGGAERQDINCVCEDNRGQKTEASDPRREPGGGPGMTS